MTNIHPTAVIEDGATLGADVKVGAYSVIGHDVAIGDGCDIASHVVIKGPTTLGAENRIYSFACIGDDPQDKKYAGEPTTLTIGDRNTIRESCTINRGTTQDRGDTHIGNDNWIMAYVHIAHDCVLGDNIILANNATLAGHVTVGDWAIFGGFSGAHQFCNIGAHSFMGMYSAIGKDVPAYIMAMGQPAAPRGINSEGLKRRGFSRDQVRHIRDAFKVIYRSNLLLADAITELQGRVADQPELGALIDSLTNTERSIIR
ncbi:MAG: acyl-ACP--UDP-N-acetylglucosamine O-acyltransferase [Pseudomonadota bacterium]